MLSLIEILDFFIHILVTIIGLFIFYSTYGFPSIKKTVITEIEYALRKYVNIPGSSETKDIMATLATLLYGRRSWEKRPARSPIESVAKCMHANTEWYKQNFKACKEFKLGRNKVGDDCEYDEDCLTAYCVDGGRFKSNPDKFYRDKNESEKNDKLFSKKCMLDCYPKTRDGFKCVPIKTKAKNNNKTKYIILSYAVALVFLPFLYFSRPISILSWLKSGVLLGLAAIVGEYLFFELYFAKLQLVSREDVPDILKYLKRSE